MLIVCLTNPQTQSLLYTCIIIIIITIVLLFNHYIIIFEHSFIHPYKFGLRSHKNIDWNKILVNTHIYIYDEQHFTLLHYNLKIYIYNTIYIYIYKSNYLNLFASLIINI